MDRKSFPGHAKCEMNQVTELLSMAGVKKNANIIADAPKEFYAFVSKSFRKNGGLRPPRNDSDTKVDISKTFAQFNLVTITISSKFEKNYMEGLLRPICGSWPSGHRVVSRSYPSMLATVMSEAGPIVPFSRTFDLCQAFSACAGSDTAKAG